MWEAELQIFAKNRQSRHILSASLLLLLASCGGGSGAGASVSPLGIGASPPPPPPPSVGAAGITPTEFTEQAVLKGLSFSHGFSDDMNAMVRQFAGGAAAGDIDQDGDIDLVIVRGNLGPNLVYLNDGSQFRETGASAGIAYTLGPLENGRHSAPTLADIDQDGDLDLFIGGLEGDPSKLYLNDGTGIFEDVTSGSGFDTATSHYTISAAFGDYDRDGDLDLALAHWGTPRSAAQPGETETLWRNDSTSQAVRFTPISAAAGLADQLALSSTGGVFGADYDYSFAPSFTDIDNDGWLDLLLVADFGGSRIFLNNRDGTFANITDATEITDENGMGSAVGDYDNDGDMDWFVSSINGNRLYENTGANMIQAPATLDVLEGGWGWGSCFADFNGDGWLDIYQTNGWFAGQDPTSSPYVEDATRLWMNTGEGGFVDKAADYQIRETAQGRGAICDDFDNDGDVDVLLLTLSTTQSPYLWINTLDSGQYLSVELIGSVENPFAIGARLRVTAGGLTQIRDVAINSNFTTHSAVRQIFGLGTATRISTLEITWPDGAQSEQKDLNPNQHLVLRHPNAAP